jgi:hypothetical protein
VVLQPHRAPRVTERRLASGDLVVDNLAAHDASRLLPSPVRPPAEQGLVAP